ncbi:TRAP transporter large permease subunit [Ammoniphilus sp. YIM 78166]|uniref:TRAP transporter large permease subunit n=1 Tax=Ammoniphilus sp. YIM 78166 TaxID=1644106 RepID=UPI001430104B|nr:TRAP transporter large permease subunit [Ammoniphilus sp. YIM 78166]
MSTTAFQGIREYIFGVIPLFVLMGLLSNVAGASTELYQSFHVLLRRIRGGLGMATVGANAVFATITGVSVASAAVFSKVSLGPMTNLKYDKKFALGTIAGSSVLGMLIPPSLLFIIYGMLAEVSVGKLFIAGIIPGILLSFIFCLGIFVLSKLKPELVGGESSEGNGKWTREDLKTIFRPWAIGILVVLMLGGLYGGYFTPTEAGGGRCLRRVFDCYIEEKAE